MPQVNPYTNDVLLIANTILFRSKSILHAADFNVWLHSTYLKQLLPVMEELKGRHLLALWYSFSLKQQEYYLSVIIGNISNPFTARFLKMPCIIKYLPSMATTSDTEGEQCSQISVPEQGVTGRHSSLNLLFEKSE